MRLNDYEDGQTEEEIEDERAEVRKLFGEWEEAVAEEDEANSKVSSLEQSLAEFGIDPDSPPEWVYSE